MTKLAHKSVALIYIIRDRWGQTVTLFSIPNRDSHQFIMVSDHTAANVVQVFLFLLLPPHSFKDVSPPGFQKNTLGTKSRRTHGLF